MVRKQKVYRTSEAAKYLGISRQRIDAMIQSGIIQAEVDPFSGWRFITESELRRVKADRRPAGRPRRQESE